MDSNEIIKYVSDGFDRAKSGNASEVYKKVAELHDGNALPLKSHYPFGWIIYYALHQSPDYDIKERKLMLARYLKLSVAKPHKLHSMILQEAIRLARDASEVTSAYRKNDDCNWMREPVRFSIVKFFELWGPTNLRPGDHKRKEHDGQTLPSVVEKLITQYVEELYGNHLSPSDVFVTLAENALAHNPQSANLYAQVARLYELKGDKAQAIGIMRKAVLAAPTKFYLWSRLAELISDPNQRRLKIALLYKALRAPGQEEFKGKIRMTMAKLLAEAGSKAQARWELLRVKEMYERHGWRLPRLYQEIDQNIPADVAPADPTPAYRKVEYIADGFIYESLPVISVKKSYHKAPTNTPCGYPVGRGMRTAWRVTDEAGNNYWLQPTQFNIAEDLPLGTPLSIKTFEGKVVTAILNVTS